MTDESEGKTPEGERPSGQAEVDLEPMTRDRSFVWKLVLALAAGIAVATFVGVKLQSAAAGCGAGIIRPGSSVIPPGDTGR